MPEKASPGSARRGADSGSGSAAGSGAPASSTRADAADRPPSRKAARPPGKRLSDRLGRPSRRRRQIRIGMTTYLNDSSPGTVMSALEVASPKRTVTWSFFRLLSTSSR